MMIGTVTDSRRAGRVSLMIGLILAGGCSLGTAGAGRDDQTPLFRGMGSHHRSVSTQSPAAQKYFDQGLIWAYAFNHDEAIRSFERAGELDPDLAMAWWGVALCHGPHINNPVMPEERSKAAWAALQKALSLKQHANATEQALIDALAARYADPPPADRAALDAAYAQAMKAAWAAHREDADVGTLYAEAMMDLRPWDLWTKDGTMRPGTEEILATLEEVLRIDANHPGANHLYIHAVEASPEPARGNAAADRLRKGVPASGHLVHMPSHIDVLTGRWAAASKQNEMAIRADRAYRAKSPQQEFYRVYMAHNHHMLAFASMMEGRSEAAIRAARDLVTSVPEEYLQSNAALVDAFMGAVYDTLKRFGRWDEILEEPAPPACLPITTAMWHLHRAVAYAAKGEIESAEKERLAFQEAVAKVPDDATMAINPAKHILQIATHFLNGEMAFRRGAIDESVSELNKAVELEDSLMYMEPPEWVQPVRHTLGAVLLHSGRYEEAEKVYREDLKEWPNNGWSLYGLSRSLSGNGSAAEAREVMAQFKGAWARADVQIETSCLCIPKT